MQDWPPSAHSQSCVNSSSSTPSPSRRLRRSRMPRLLLSVCPPSLGHPLVFTPPPALRGCTLFPSDEVEKLTACFPLLSRLSLSECSEVNDSAVKPLHALPLLAELNLQLTSITQSSIEWIMYVFSSCLANSWLLLGSARILKLSLLPAPASRFPLFPPSLLSQALSSSISVTQHLLGSFLIFLLSLLPAPYSPSGNREIRQVPPQRPRPARGRPVPPLWQPLCLLLTLSSEEIDSGSCRVFKTDLSPEVNEGCSVEERLSRVRSSQGLGLGQGGRRVVRVLEGEVLLQEDGGLF